MNMIKKYSLIYLLSALFLAGCGSSGEEGARNNDGSGSYNSGTALLSWMPPTENTDGSSLVDLAGYRIYYGTSPGSYSEVVALNDAGLSSYLVDNLAPDNWYFVMTSINSSNIESAYSTEVSKVIN